MILKKNSFDLFHKSSLDIYLTASGWLSSRSCVRVPAKSHQRPSYNGTHCLPAWQAGLLG